MKLFYYIWAFIERFGTNIVSLGGNIILSYFIQPKDFGLIAMLGIFSSLIFVFIDCGLSDRLLMQEKPANRDFNTVFYFNISSGCCIFLIYCMLSPYVANYFRNPEIKNILIFFGIGAIISSLSISQITKLRSQLQFKKVATLNISSIISALIVAILMALSGMEYWALVGLQLCYPLFYLIYLIIFSKWDLKFEFDFLRFKSMWKFGVNLLLSTILTQMSRNIFAFVIGKYYTQAQAGYFGQAQKLQETPTNSLENTISMTSYVLIAKETDPQKRKMQIISSFEIMTFINIAFCALLLSISYPVIDLIFAEKWLPIIPYLRILLIWGMIYPISSFMGIIFKLYNRTDIIRNIFFVEKILIVIIALSFYKLGVFMLILLTILLSTLTLIMYIVSASKLIQIKISVLFKVLRSNAILMLSPTIIAYLSTFIFGSSLISILIAFIIYLFILAIECRFFKRPYYDYVIQLSKKVSDRIARR